MTPKTLRVGNIKAKAIKFCDAYYEIKGIFTEENVMYSGDSAQFDITKDKYEKLFKWFFSHGPWRYEATGSYNTWRFSKVNPNVSVVFYSHRLHTDTSIPVGTLFIKR